MKTHSIKTKLYDSIQLTGVHDYITSVTLGGAERAPVMLLRIYFYVVRIGTINYTLRNKKPLQN
jgi:hypothetical protein